MIDASFRLDLVIGVIVYSAIVCANTEARFEQVQHADTNHNGLPALIYIFLPEHHV